ncbi:MAG: hypothetical protein KAT65_10770 [Methanophagales archaeon]|nr:hypothetical protein [Methanophagales archaeon]
MSEERDKDENVEKLKKELKELIEHKIEYNNGFANLLRGDYSLFISLIALFLSVYGAWKLGFLARHYVLSVYLMFGIWLLYIIGSIIRAPREQEDVIKLISTYQERIRVVISWYFKWARSMFYSLWMLFLLCIVVLLFLRDFRLWLWAPAILFTLFLPPIAEKGSAFLAALLDKARIEEPSTFEEKKVSAIVTIMRILILAIVVLYLCYIIYEYNPYSIFEVILTVILILISLAFLSEYLSMKFMVTEVSNQNYKLSMLRMGIDGIEGAEALEKKKKELLKLFLPKADSFLVFFNYYYLMLTPYTFEVDEEEEKEQKS